MKNWQTPTSDDQELHWRIELRAPALQVDSLPAELPGKPNFSQRLKKIMNI